MTPAALRSGCTAVSFSIKRRRPSMFTSFADMLEISDRPRHVWLIRTHMYVKVRRQDLMLYRVPYLWNERYFFLEATSQHYSRVAQSSPWYPISQMQNASSPGPVHTPLWLHQLGHLANAGGGSCASSSAHPTSLSLLIPSPTLMR